jgi:hypothetical protein
VSGLEMEVEKAQVAGGFRHNLAGGRICVVCMCGRGYTHVRVAEC